MVNTTPTGQKELHIKSFVDAASLLIKARSADNEEFITLRYLQRELGAQSDAEKNSVLWGVRHCKDAGIIGNTTARGVYRVL